MSSPSSVSWPRSRPQPAAAGPKNPVTVEIDADLLRRAESLNMDLGAFLEKHLATALGDGTPVSDGPADKTHRDVLVAAMDNLEAINLAPLQINPSMSPAEVVTQCESVLSIRSQLLANAEMRRSLPFPDSLDEVRALDQYRMERLQTIKARINEQGRVIQANRKVMEKHCPGLKDEDPTLKSAFKTVLAPYGPREWCQAMQRKPQSEWSMNDGFSFAKYCTGGKAK